MTSEIDIQQTPFISVDLEKLQKNISDMQSIADKAGVTMRPHGKTHKCAHMAKMQIDAGAKGLTVAKPEEAIAFIKAGISSIKICYPIISEDKISELLKKAKEYSAEILFVIDSAEGLKILEAAAQNHKIVLPVYIEIDVGLNRCGITPEDLLLLKLCREIDSSAHLKFVGLTSHAGQSYGGPNADRIKEIAENEIVIMNELAGVIRNSNIDFQEICIGSTPTLWVQKNFQGVTQIKPGNYVFNDLTQKNIGAVPWERLALSVVSTVVSVNDTYMIIDAGSKTLTSDMGAHGTSNVKGFGVAFLMEEQPNDETGYVVEKLSEEHGWVKHNGQKLAIGTKLRIYPNHACPIVNLFNEIHVFENGKLKDKWPVEARGCIH